MAALSFPSGVNSVSLGLFMVRGMAWGRRLKSFSLHTVVPVQIGPTHAWAFCSLELNHAYIWSKVLVVEMGLPSGLCNAWPWGYNPYMSKKNVIWVWRTQSNIHSYICWPHLRGQHFALIPQFAGKALPNSHAFCSPVWQKPPRFEQTGELAAQKKPSFEIKSVLATKFDVQFGPKCSTECKPILICLDVWWLSALLMFFSEFHSWLEKCQVPPGY